MKEHLLWLCALALLMVLACLLLAPADILSGARLEDTDAYMRLVRVRLLVESGAWFDASVPRSNWPFGETLHWTRPMDLVLLLGAAPFWPFVGFDAALAQSGVWVPPLLLVVTYVVVAWSADPVVGTKNRGFVLLLMPTQVVVLAYAQPGRPDHHALILLVFALGLGFLFRGLESPSTRRWARGLGGASALGMWVSPEFLLPLGLFFLGTMVAWVRGGGQLVRFNRSWTATFVVCLTAFLLIERGTQVSLIEYDKIAWVHVVMAALAFAVWWSLGRLQARVSHTTIRARALAGGALGATSLALMASFFPRFFGGPMVDVTHPAVRSWLHRVAELQPVLLPDDARGVGMLLLCGGTALVATPYLAANLTRRDTSWDSRLTLLVGIVAVFALALVQIRWITYVQIMAAIGAADLLARLPSFVPRAGGSTRGALLLRISATVILTLGPLSAGAIVVSATRPPQPPSSTAPCAIEAVATFLTARPDEGNLTVAANPDLGPAALYRTDHRVLATPYHRNEAGIRAVYDLFAATDLDAAETIVAERGIDRVTLCPGRDDGLVPASSEGRPTLYGRLLRGDPPAWLIEITPPGSEAVRHFRVEPDAFGVDGPSATRAPGG